MFFVVNDCDVEEWMIEVVGLMKRDYVDKFICWLRKVFVLGGLFYYG